MSLIIKIEQNEIVLHTPKKYSVSMRKLRAVYCKFCSEEIFGDLHDRVLCFNYDIRKLSPQEIDILLEDIVAANCRACVSSSTIHRIRPYGCHKCNFKFTNLPKPEELTLILAQARIINSQTSN